MANSERVAMAAHLHVALRRKAGRVTDTDWMAVNDVYALEVVRFAHEKALETGDAALEALANKLALHMQVAASQAPVAASLVARMVKAAQGEQVTQHLRSASPPPQAPDDAVRYIGGLR